MATPFDRRPIASGISLLALVLAGCGGEPGDREVGDGRAFEALLSAVLLRDAKALEAASAILDRRHESGELSGANYRELAAVVAGGRARDWAGAEALAYAFRARFGDRGAYFR